MRRNPLLFKADEYQFLHRVYLSSPARNKTFELIKRKKGIGLSKKEILFVKRKFSEWRDGHKNELLWMENN